MIDRDITAHIWSTRFDRDRDELAASQPSLAQEIARAAEQAIAAAERRHALHGQSRHLDPGASTSEGFGTAGVARQPIMPRHGACFSARSKPIRPLRLATPLWR